MIDNAVSKLATYALRTGLIEECDRTWAINTILDVLKLDSYTEPNHEWGEIELAPVLENCWNTPAPGASSPRTRWSTGTCSIPSSWAASPPAPPW